MKFVKFINPVEVLLWVTAVEVFLQNSNCKCHHSPPKKSTSYVSLIICLWVCVVCISHVHFAHEQSLDDTW